MTSKAERFETGLAGGVAEKAEEADQARSLQAQEKAKVDSGVEVSVVMPCLNEVETVGICVEKAKRALDDAGLEGEIIVADNGSDDGSIREAKQAGAIVVHQDKPGYGFAYHKGVEAASGQYIIMADSDNTYDFVDIPKFLKLLREGYDLVMGNRFAGEIKEGAMPWLHQYIGNPLLSGILNFFFKSGIGDAHCGMRAFTREAWQRMHLRTGGMEFASEMVINAAKGNLKITEIPITYYPREGESKLSSFRDGWRHLRFMLLYSPTHLFLWPGGLLMALGGMGVIVLAGGPFRIDGITFGVFWMFLASLLLIVGFQIICLGFFARVYSLSSHIDHGRDRLVSFFTENFRMESGILNGSILLLAGLFAYGYIFWLGISGGLAQLSSIRLGILALTLTTLGAQVIFASFFISMMVIRRYGWPE